MKLEFNIEKRWVFAILGFIAIVGFVIAQTPPNPGHPASQVFISGISNSLENWATSADGTLNSHSSSISSLQIGINDHETAIGILQSQTWNGPDLTTTAPYYTGFISAGNGVPHTIPSTIPNYPNAKAILVYVRFELSTNPPFPQDAIIYTNKGLVGKNTQKVAISPGNSDTLWLPLNSNSNDRTLYVTAPSSGYSYLPGSRVEIIGWK